VAIRFQRPPRIIVVLDAAPIFRGHQAMAGPIVSPSRTVPFVPRKRGV